MLSAFQLPKEEVDDFSAIIYEPLRPRHCKISSPLYRTEIGCLGAGRPFIR